MALEKIVELENITADAKEIEEQIEKMAKDYGITADQVKKAVPESEIAKDIEVNKAIDFVKKNAVITEVKEKKAPTKKAAAKKTKTDDAEKSAE